jgi:hypothetical protein
VLWIVENFQNLEILSMADVNLFSWKYGLHLFYSSQLNILEECAKKEVFPKMKILNIGSAFGSEYENELGKILTKKFPNLIKLFMSGWRLLSVDGVQNESDIYPLDSLEVNFFNFLSFFFFSLFF